MARHFSTWRLAYAALLIIVAMFGGSQAALAQFTWTQDTLASGNWNDAAHWGGSGFPNAAGATAFIQMPPRNSGAYTLTVPAGDTTVGSLTLDNTGYGSTSNFTIAQAGGSQLVFQSNTSDPAKYTETVGTNLGTTTTGRTTISSPITARSNWEITAANIPGLNTGTTFSNRITGALGITITKKGDKANLQLNDVGPLAAGEGFLGDWVIDTNGGGIRLIDTAGIYNAHSFTVKSGGQLQLGQAGSASSGLTYRMATDAPLILNGTGKTGGNNFDGALRYQGAAAASAGFSGSFENPVTLESDSRISVNPLGTGTHNLFTLTNVISGSGDLIKSGPGDLKISNANNTYTGDTQVVEGLLILDNPYLAIGADVYLPNLAATGALNLNFSATNTIRSLFINDGTNFVAASTGLWGATDNIAATNHTDKITGPGMLLVTTAPVLGDFNGNGTVDAADYIMWRNGDPALMQNQVTDPLVADGQDYLDWEQRFGNISGASSGGELAGLASVPEPTTALLTLFALCWLLAMATRRPVDVWVVVPAKLLGNQRT